MAKKLILSTAVVALLLSLTSLGFAQGSSESSVRGNLGGVVEDASGAVVSGAKVTLATPTGAKTEETGSEGRFLFQILTPGRYTVKIEKSGFKSTEVKDVEVVTGRTSNVNAKLEIGSADTVVEVTGEALSVDTSSTAVSSNLTDTFYQSVPVARNVTGLFYAAPGVASGGGSGTANPSISGGTGLENNYVADGVSITDAGFGGIGVYSRNYGSLSTGINLSFVKEVQVKTGGFEAQYGKSTGGIVQIVTKSGSNQTHGSIGGFFGPQQFEGSRLFSDDFAAGTQNTLYNRQGKILHESQYDLDAEIGGHVPGLKDHLFFFGSFNPQWNTDQDQLAQYLNPSDLLNGTPTQTSLGNRNIGVRVFSYAGKGTLKLNDHHQVEVSLFGDPTYGDFNPNGNAGLQTASASTFDKLQYGTRNLVTRYNATISPTWLFNASFTWGHNNLTDTPSPLTANSFWINDQTQRNPCFEPAGSPLFNPFCVDSTSPQRGIYQRQGLGYYENTKGDAYGLNFDTTKTFNFLGQHNLTFGYKYDRSHYDGNKAYTGATIPIDPATAANAGAPTQAITDALVANGTTAEFYLRGSAAWCGIAELVIPGQNGCGDGGTGVRLIQIRGEFGNLNFKTTSRYHTLFAQDAWSPSKYVTINAGIRWEQQHVAGNNAAYTFNDNWSPRIGVSVDPWGNRKTKATVNFGRYTEALPLDIAIRSLSSEFDAPNAYWAPPNDGAGHVLVNPDGTLDFSNFSVANNLTPYTDPANDQPNAALGKPAGFVSGVSAQSSVAFGKGTRSEYLDEFQLGFEHEFNNSGVIFTAHYTDRRLKRIIEDNAAISPEAYQNNLAQTYFISNPNKAQDLFHNPVEIPYTQVFDANGLPTLPAPGSCASSGTNQSIVDAQAVDSNGNVVTNSNGNNAFCVPNAFDANGATITGLAGADGNPDGFVDPVRKYRAMEFEVNKSFSKGWQMRANYRIAKLEGNYEGSFRNDNGQSDPNISSLFDFTQGQFNLLGQQFVPGVLNTDVRHLANGFVSYVLGNTRARGLTLGSSVHFQTGIPINNLFAHPAYQNAGEIPFCADNTTNCASARGALGRTKDFGQVDFHTDYPVRVGEGKSLRFAADLFNIADSRTQLRVNQFAQRSFQVPNADFLKPTGTGPSAVNGNTNPAYLRPFYARLSVKFEF